MKPEDIRKHLEESGALLEGHFLLSSGRHSDRYVQCARALEDPRLGGTLGAALARPSKTRASAGRSGPPSRASPPKGRGPWSRRPSGDC